MPPLNAGGIANKCRAAACAEMKARKSQLRGSEPGSLGADREEDALPAVPAVLDLLAASRGGSPHPRNPPSALGALDHTDMARTDSHSTPQHADDLFDPLTNDNDDGAGQSQGFEIQRSASRSSFTSEGDSFFEQIPEEDWERFDRMSPQKPRAPPDTAPLLESPTKEEPASSPLFPTRVSTPSPAPDPTGDVKVYKCVEFMDDDEMADLPEGFSQELRRGLQGNFEDAEDDQDVDSVDAMVQDDAEDPPVSKEPSASLSSDSGERDGARRGLQGVHPMPPPPPPRAAAVPPSRTTTLSTVASGASSTLAGSKRTSADVYTPLTSQSSIGDSPKRRRTASWVEGAGTARDAGCAPFFLAYDEARLPYMARLPFYLMWDQARSAQDAEAPPPLPVESIEIYTSNSGGARFLADRWMKPFPYHANRLQQAINSRVPEELDFENTEMEKNPHACLGGGAPDQRYGGRVTFSVQLDYDKTKRDPLVVTLNEPVVGTSMRLARRFGSDRVLRVRITQQLRKGLKQAEIVELFQRPFVIHSHVYRLLQRKDETMIMLRTDETLLELGIYHGALPSPNIVRPTGFTKLTVDAFFEWYNPPAYNGRQAATKYFSRTDLMLSTSVPGPKLEKMNVHFIDDLFPPGHGPSSPAEFCLTDGCGFVNHAFLKYCQRVVNKTHLPTGVQGRLAAFKGLFVRHPDEALFRGSPEPEIWVRDSQVKVKYPAFALDSELELDPAMLVFDILNLTHTSPARLSTQFIINLWHNGVPSNVFVKLLEDKLNELVASLTTWNGPNALPNLVHTLEIEGGLRFRNLAALAGGEAKARGFRVRDEQDGFAVELDDGNVFEDEATPVVVDDPSGCSPIWDERCTDLLKASFTPQSCPFLHDTLQSVTSRLIRDTVQKAHIALRCSASVKMIPDPMNVLRPGEVYFHPSEPLLDCDGYEFDVLRGPCIIGRHPCMVPSDIQKVVAVDYPELSGYRDVLVCSVQDTYSAASLLAGGDYDGDTATISWDRDIVGPFTMTRETTEKFARPPANLSDYFVKDAAKTVAELVRDGELSSQRPAFILGSLEHSDRVGRVSKFHVVSTYVTSYDDPTTVILAYLFCTLLDSAKSGKRVTEEAFQRLTKQFGGRSPAWAETEAERIYGDKSTNENNPRRPADAIGPFVMDALREHGDEMADEHIRKYPAMKDHDLDRDLARVWEEERLIATKFRFKDHFDKIEVHVNNIFKEYRSLIGDYANKKQGTTTRGPESPSKKRSKRSGKGASAELERGIRRLRLRFACGPVLPEPMPYRHETLRNIKASCAYLIGTKAGGACGTKFPFEMALQDLCAIKATASGKKFHTIANNFHLQMQTNRF